MLSIDDFKFNLNLDTTGDTLFLDVSDKLVPKNTQVNISIYRNSSIIFKEKSLDTLKFDIANFNDGRFSASISFVFNRSMFFKRSNIIFKGENLYEFKDKKITYYFEENQSKKLLIIFSAMVPDYKYVYNYLNALDDVPLNKLYILDNIGKKGCYYLGSDGKLDFEESVYNLINSIILKKSLNKKDIYTIGSSKGGFSAIYYGFKYNFGKVIVGAPQFLLGDFLFDHYNGKNREMGEFISGYKDPVIGKIKLNSILENILTKGKDTYLYLLIGVEDDHYAPQFRPFLNHLAENNISHSLFVHKDLNHKNLSLLLQKLLSYFLIPDPTTGALKIDQLAKISDSLSNIENTLDLPDIVSLSNNLKESLALDDSSLNKLLIEMLLYTNSENYALRDLICNFNLLSEKLLSGKKSAEDDLIIVAEKLKRIKLFYSEKD